jgi:Tol biopolymer transport system component
VLRLGTVLAAAALICSSSAADGAYPGRNGSIVFAETASGRGGSGWDSILTVRADGTGLRKLTESLEQGFMDFEPAWSPDGKRIAFVRSTGNTIGPETIGTEIWVMNADGTHKRRLTRNRLADESPTWSPDGRRILFSRGRVRFGDRHHRPHSDLWTMNADGTRQRQLTHTRAIELEPAWAPRGGRIACLVAPAALHWDQLAYTIGPKRTLWTAAPDGSRRRLTAIGDALAPSAPDWSPDGTRLAIGTNKGIVTIDAGGGDQRVVGPGSDPAWAPDGSSLVVSVFLGEYAELRVLAFDGTSRVLTSPAVITETSVEQYDPDWQPLPRYERR